jgi:hypothetical protein
MKNLFLFFVAVSVLFAIGCQENTITDPLSTESPGIQSVTNVTAVKNLTPDLNDVPDIIRFENELPSPYPSLVPECFIVAGMIEVDHKVWPLDPIPPNPQYRITVGLRIDAEMNCGDERARNRWFIECDTENTIYFSGDEAFTLTKYYTVEGRSDRMQLVVDYEVTLDGVSLKSMELRLPKYQVDKIPNNF